MLWISTCERVLWLLLLLLLLLITSLSIVAWVCSILSHLFPVVLIPCPSLVSEILLVKVLLRLLIRLGTVVTSIILCSLSGMLIWLSLCSFSLCVIGVGPSGMSLSLLLSTCTHPCISHCNVLILLIVITEYLIRSRDELELFSICQLDCFWLSLSAIWMILLCKLIEILLYLCISCSKFET